MTVPDDPPAQGSTADEAHATTLVTETPKARARDLLVYARPYRRTLVAAMITSLVGASMLLAQPVLVRELIATVQRGSGTGALVAVLTVAVLVGAAFGGLQQYLLIRVAEGIVRSARRTIAGHLLRLPVAEIDARRTGDLVSRVGSDTTLLRGVITSGVVDAFGSVLIFGGSVVAMLVLDPVLFGVTAVVVLIATATIVVVGRRIRELSEAAQARLGDMIAAVSRALPAARTIRASGATARETESIGADADRAYQAGLQTARLLAVVEPIASTAMQLAFLLVLGLGGYRVANGSIEVGDLVAFVLFLFLMVLPLGQAFQAYSSIQVALGALGRIQEVLTIPVEDAADERDSRGRSPWDRPAGSAGSVGPALELDRVTFGYADGQPVLRGVSFAVPRGAMTAIVGPSGAGKSTVLALVERFYDATDGAVRVGGLDVRVVDRALLRAGIGYVEQGAPVLAGTLRDNLLLTAPDASDETLLHVLADVRLVDLVDRDPRGLSTPVGDDGILLSGGERQRLAIARALLRAPHLLLLDEPTASLDARNEQALRTAIDVAASGRTVVVVAHRMSTVAHADQIVVLDRGAVVAVGTHAELLADSPLYREFAQHQLLI